MGVFFYSRNFKNHMSTTYCASCKIAKLESLKFIIGAKSDNPHSKDDWCLVEGSGRLVCPSCYPSELERGKALIEKHIAAYNAQATSFR